MIVKTQWFCGEKTIVNSQSPRLNKKQKKTHHKLLNQGIPGVFDQYYTG
jgi:hypothetical protein